MIVTKTDLINAEQLANLQNANQLLRELYGRVLHGDQSTQSTHSGFVSNKISVVAGQSGVGKSTLINVLTGSTIETQAISQALGRGKHTTRHSELLPLLGGYVGDTPGFGTVDFMDWTKDQLRDSFHDFVTLGEQCKFRGCYHLQEPQCSVKQSNVLPSRYESYVLFQEEVLELKRYKVKP